MSDSGARFSLAYFVPHSGRNEELERRYPYKSLVAFSGTVEDSEAGESYTESRMNGGLAENRTRDTFARPEYRFLVVAEKFQTGFDQPLLHTMYVDKKLGGVGAVQTLSRLNRTHPGKEETMVLDFANDAETIRKAFEPYYETTILSEATDPNLLYDRRHELEDMAVFTREEVDAVAELYFSRAPQGKLYRALDPVKDRAEEELDEAALAELRGALGDYARLYAFLSQVVSFEDPELEKLYVFTRLLRRYLDPVERPLPREIQEKIDMDSLRIDRTHRGSIELSRGHGRVDPIGDRGTLAPPVEELEPLSEILRELNDRFGADLGPEDRITLGRVLDRAEQLEALRLSVESNTEENARLAFETTVPELLQSLVETNFQLYKRISDDRDFRKVLMQRLFDEYVRRVADNGLDEEALRAEIAEGETKHREFKSTLRVNLHTGKKDERMTEAALKTLAAFLNAEGGVLYLGVADDGAIVGIERDGFPNEDRFLLHLDNVAKKALGQATAARLSARTWTFGERTVCRVECPPSPRPVFAKLGGREKFYVRSGPSSEELTPSEMHAYIGERFGE